MAAAGTFAKPTTSRRTNAAAAARVEAKGTGCTVTPNRANSSCWRAQKNGSPETEGQ
ncbi:MAG: hypothetical protein HC918_09980 [Oscillatoriales cyanobacterium SM2_1_8]|nr:hypothetical protein [Oscillatoriales cyanobacterium SM2_1_8]